MTEPPERPTPPEPPGEFSDFFHTDELPTGPVPRRSHRGDRADGPFGNRLLAPLTAVVVVVVVILLLIWINGKPSGKGPGPGVISAPTGHTQSVPASPLPTHTVPATHSAAPTHTAHPTHSATSAPSLTPTPSISTKPARTVSTAMAPVQVLNNSTISGLAAQVAAEVRAKGWKVPAVGNEQGIFPVTTVLFPRGERAAAKHLEHDFPSIRRIEPYGAGATLGAHGRELTLVVTRDWSN